MKPLALPTVEQWAELSATAANLVPGALGNVHALGHLVALCIEHPSTPDGWPTRGGSDEPVTTTRGDDSQAPAGPDDEGPLELTTVERAALARLGTRPTDPIDRKVIAAAAALDKALGALATVEHLVAELVKLRTPPDPWADRPTPCSLMAEVGVYEPALVGTTTLGDLLPDERPVGRWAYDFARRTGRLPTLEQRLAHADGKRVRIGASTAVVVVTPHDEQHTVV